MLTSLLVLATFLGFLFSSAVPVAAPPYDWTVKKGARYLIQSSSKVKNTFTITIKRGSVNIIEGDRQRPNPKGDGKTELKEGRSVTIAPNPENDLYLVGVDETSNGTYVVECAPKYME